MIECNTILTTGANGMLGGYAAFGIRTGRKDFDIEDIASVRATLAKHHPKAILHFAAATDFVACEKDPAGTYRTNAMGTYNIALAAREVGATMVYVSTSVVFDGKKDEPYTPEDTPSPQTHYGHSKYAGELLSAGLAGDHIIARACWLFGGGPNRDRRFVSNIIKQLGNPRIEVIGGKCGSPTYGKDFVEALLQLLDQGERGTFHISNEGAPTRADIAREIVRITGSAAEVVETDASVFEARYPGAGARGNESMLSSLPMRPWQEALKEYIETEWGGSVRKPQ